MLRNWILLALIAVGWLLPSGARLPLCGCLFAGDDAPTCCAIEAPVEPACCSARADSRVPDADEDPREERRGEGPSAGREDACTCSVTVLAHDDTLPAATTTNLGEATALAALHAPVLPSLANRLPGRAPPSDARPRGPSPGGRVPLPLRL